MNKNANKPISLSSLPGFQASRKPNGESKGKAKGKPKGKAKGDPSPPKGLTLRPGQVVCGDLDMHIDLNGVWHYHGSPIGRKELVRLFSTVLRRDEAGDYWLITPAEAGRIEVEDAPFLAVELSLQGSGADQVISFRTNVDNHVTVDADHPIRVDFDPETGDPTPYVVLDGGLEARISRSVYYELVALGQEEKGQEKKGRGGKSFGVWSAGNFFSLGKLEDEPEERP